ncbi:MAG: trypsin-like peptidase domain-containing protein [Candidatus Accumulibacter sp.]|jgi:serine protease DegQ|nr:trypsin-like peptidase domain-containing protein [Accumulibacter sp.]
MRKLWLIFAQTVTIVLAVSLVTGTFKPEWPDTLSGILAFRSDAEAPAPEAADRPPSAPSAPSEVSSAVPSAVPSSPAAPLAAAGEPPRPDAPSARQSFREAAKVALPSVVHIFTSQKIRAPRHPLAGDPLFRYFFGDEPEIDQPRKSGLGSGVIVSADGYVLTNYHVIEGADQIEIALDNGRTHKAQPVGGDPETDLAVLKLLPGKDGTEVFPAIALGQMDDVVVGDIALAIGNPFGVGQTVTMGIVSALGRSHLGINTFENFIQTDAAINPGNSGGALVDVHGQLIGINTAIYSRSGGSLGIGFAIPVSTARSIMEQIIRNGSVVRGWIGVEVQEITEELAESFGLPDTDGALIAGVQRGSPADKGGIKPGDVLLAVADQPVKDAQAMLNLIAALVPGETVAFTFRRQTRPVSLQIRVGKRPPLRRDARE